MTARAEPSSAELALPAPRAVARLTGITVWTAAWTLVLLTGRLLGGRWGWTLRCRRTWARGMLALLGVRMRRPMVVPETDALYIANHLGYLDILVLATILPVRFVAKREVATWPVWGPLARWTGTLFIDRERPRDAVRVNDAVHAALARDESVLVFAEGTSSPGDGVLPLRPALLAPATAPGTILRPLALHYRIPNDARGAREKVCWWGEMEFLPHLVAMAAVPTIEATVVVGDPVPPAPDRKTMAGRTHAALVQLHRTIIQEAGDPC